MDASAPPEQAGRDDACVIEDEELVAPQKTWKFHEQTIFENS